MKRPRIVLVTPAAAVDNNGNWQTAQRWERFLRADYRVAITQQWAGGDEALMIALHARRSAASVRAWRAAHPQRPLVLVLTGTDLYRDIATDAAAQQSLQWADRLVVLNDCGLQALPPALRGKGLVCLQSSPSLATRPKSNRHLRVVMVGHLREEKSPQTYFAAARLLQGRADITLEHIGAGLDPALAGQARALTQQCASYRWRGALPHAQTRRRIQAAHLLVQPSRMEGGAHAVIEALTSGTPVLASRIDGNVGLLGADYGGLFELGDAAALASLLERARADAAMLPDLVAQCARRAPLFHPDRERATLRALLGQMLHQMLAPAAPPPTEKDLP